MAQIARVVNIPRRSLSVEWVSNTDAFTLVQEEARLYMRSGKKVGKMADDIGICHATLSNIIYGETKEPRASTLIRCLRYFGFIVRIER